MHCCSVCSLQGEISVFIVNLGRAAVCVCTVVRMKSLVLRFWYTPPAAAETEEAGWPWSCAETASVIMVIPSPWIPPHSELFLGDTKLTSSSPTDKNVKGGEYFYCNAASISLAHLYGASCLCS